MTNATRVAELATSYIKRFEGCVLAAYPDPATHADPWTIGYGATGPGIARGVVWTQAQADEDLARRVADMVPRVLALVKVPLPDGALAALCSISYNIGCPKPCAVQPNAPLDCCTCRLRTSTVLRLVNVSDFDGAAHAFDMWNKAAGQVNAGLAKRRGQERELFLSAIRAPRAPAGVT